MISASAMIGRDCDIHTTAWIGENCILRNNVTIGANVRLESRVIVGNNGRLLYQYDHVILYEMGKYSLPVNTQEGCVKHLES